MLAMDGGAGGELGHLALARSAGPGMGLVRHACMVGQEDEVRHPTCIRASSVPRALM